MHKSVKLDKEQPKKLPKTVKYCNARKGGLDILHQMARQNACKSGSWEWIVASFFKIFDLTCVTEHCLQMVTINANYLLGNFS